jgi:sugar lactone lactonase YvrE
MIRSPKALLYAMGVLLTIMPTIGCGPQSADTPGSLTPPGVTLEEVWKLAAGMDRPESVVYDAERDLLYLSVIVGQPWENDGIGYIAKVSTDGEMLDSTWVSGLNAPKGLALDASGLYVADNHALLRIDPATGQVTARFEVADEPYLNDVSVAADGSVFVSDSRSNRIFKLSGDTFEVWTEGPTLHNPNGVHVVGEELFVAAAAAEAENPGQERYLQAISLADRSIRPVFDTAPKGALDAIEPDGRGGYFITDWVSGELMHFTPEGGYVVHRELGPGAADADFVAETARLYVPVMMEGSLTAYDVRFEP